MVSKPFLMALRIAKHSLLLEQGADLFSAYLFYSHQTIFILWRSSLRFNRDLSDGF